VQFGGGLTTVGTFDLPQQSFPWVPFVFGQLAVEGFSIDIKTIIQNIATDIGQLIHNGFNLIADVTTIANAITTFVETPLLTAAQVALGAPDGQVVATGVGNSLGTVTMFSDMGSVETDPLSGVGVVPPYHGGDEGTLFVSLINHGLIDIFNFNSGSDAQLSILVVPVYYVTSVGVAVDPQVTAQMHAPNIGTGVGNIGMIPALASSSVPAISTGVGNIALAPPRVAMPTPTITIT
jgi:hypothetical protein